MDSTLTFGLIILYVNIFSSSIAQYTSCTKSSDWTRFITSFSNFKIQFNDENLACENYKNINTFSVDKDINKAQPCLTTPKWINYKNAFSSIYKNSEEENNACLNFQKTDTFINFNNNSITILGHNNFSTWGEENFVDHKGNCYGNEIYSFKNLKTQGQRSANQLPIAIFKSTPNYKNTFKGYDASNDWLCYTRSYKDDKVWLADYDFKNYDQGRCGNCYAWAAIGSLEGAIWRATGKNYRLSVQQVTDCSSSNGYNNKGCTCGSIEEAFRYIFENGVVLAESYPNYSGMIRVTGKCQYSAKVNWSSFKAYINGIQYSNYLGVIKEVKRINPGDDEALMQALDKYGPVAVAIDSSNMKFHEYNSGFYAPNVGDCRNDTLDHVVLLVGYGVGGTKHMETYGKKYWRLKNQWGDSWGRDSKGRESGGGFMYLSREIRNNCGISSLAYVPVV